MCTVTSKGCICRYSGIRVYQPVKVIILDVNTSLLSLRSLCIAYTANLILFSWFCYFDQNVEAYNLV